MMVNPEHSYEQQSKVQIGITPDHNAGIIEVSSDAYSDHESEYGLILVTRYYKL